jgi:hypothetical protein
VDVKNTSGGDETLTLGGLTDDGFDLTSTTVTGTPVVGSTCGVATGIGTLTPTCNLGTGKCTSGNVGAACSTDGNCALQGGAFATGDLPVASSDYICYFDAQFCGSLAPTNTNTACATGISHTDTVAGTATDAEGNTATVASGQVTVNECVTLVQ